MCTIQCIGAFLATSNYPYRTCALAAVGALWAVAVAAADPGAAQGIVEGTNAFRKAQGLDPVSVEPTLEKAARGFADFMARTGKYGHGADGRQPPQRAAAAGYDACIVAENIAYAYRSSGYKAGELAGQLVEGWKNSPEHRKNMLAPPVTQTGVAIAQAKDGRHFAVQMFGRPKSAALRFSVRNRASAEISYRAGERSFSLPPRATRTHTVCEALQLRIALPGENFAGRISDGARYTVVERKGALAVEASRGP